MYNTPFMKGIQHMNLQHDRNTMENLFLLWKRKAIPKGIFKI